MSRIKTKRIVGTIAVLLVLSFVAVMVLHKHDEPKIIGDLSKEDVSEVSRVARKFEKGLMRGQLSADLQNRDGLLFIRHLIDYTQVRVHSIEAETNGAVHVTAGEGTNAESTEY